MTQTFRLIGQATVFEAVKFHTVLDDVPCVKGVTLDGKLQTCARIEDVVFLDGETEGARARSKTITRLPCHIVNVEWNELKFGPGMHSVVLRDHEGNKTDRLTNRYETIETATKHAKDASNFWYRRFSGAIG